MIYKRLLSFAVLLGIGIMIPVMGFCSVESSLSAIQSKLIFTILPLVSILGLDFAAFSFVLGSQNARSHLVLAIFGAALGFGAPSLISFIRALVD